MHAPLNAIFALYGPTRRYNSLRATYESRLANLATTVCAAVANTEDDEVFLQLNANSNTKEFAPQHAMSLIARHLVSERDTSFHGLAMKLADAEAEASRTSRRNKELSSLLSVLRGESTTSERSRIKVTEVNAEIQELRREYQVRQHCSACVSSASILHAAVFVDHWLLWADMLRTLLRCCCSSVRMYTGVHCDTFDYSCMYYIPGAR